MSVNWTKPIQTRDGRKARFVAYVPNEIDTLHQHTVIVLVEFKNKPGVYHAGFRNMDGSFVQDEENGGDIIQVEIVTKKYMVLGAHPETNWLFDHWTKAISAYSSKHDQGIIELIFKNDEFDSVGKVFTKKFPSF